MHACGVGDLDTSNEDIGDETYLMLLLSDSNLPTGSFVASSGLESYITHGFSSSTPHPTFTFIQDSLPAYARSTLPFVSDAHPTVARHISDSETADMAVDQGEGMKELLRQLAELDGLYDTMTTNHVSKRASRAQGVALLTLYSKGFSRPPSFPDVGESRAMEQKKRELIDQYKAMVRREDVPGHLPVCWGALTAALGLKLGVQKLPLYAFKYAYPTARTNHPFLTERAQYLHLFLHARSLLSASVRLNDIGPYAAQQILLHAVRPLLEAEGRKCRELRTGQLEKPGDDFDEIRQGPANTWPLGEILAARHDLQHSRIFNS